jgi:membrane-associated phospholipid phosphatase
MRLQRPAISSVLVLASLLGFSASASAQLVLPSPDTPVQASVEAPSARPPVPGFSRLFTGAVADLGRLPSKKNLTWIGIGAAAALLAHVEDTNVTSSLSKSTALGETLQSGGTLGGMPVQFGSALATYTVGRLTHSPRVAGLGADLVQAQLVAQTVSYGLKYSIQRTRPDGTSMSFPSGHAAVSFASATVLQRHFGWKAGIPAFTLASFVAGSRVQQQRHYLSDVAFGAAIGIVAGRTVTVGRGDARFAVVPAAAPGGAGVALTWLGHR